MLWFVHSGTVIRGLPVMTSKLQPGRRSAIRYRNGMELYCSPLERERAENVTAATCLVFALVFNR